MLHLELIARLRHSVPICKVLGENNLHEINHNSCKHTHRHLVEKIIYISEHLLLFLLTLALLTKFD